MIQLTNILNEDLRKWFGKGKTGSTTGGGWDKYNSQGKKVGKCGDSKDGWAAKNYKAKGGDWKTAK
jgi:hypothetical protein